MAIGSSSSASSPRVVHRTGDASHRTIDEAIVFSGAGQYQWISTATSE
jgi:hypothetical protein